MVWSVSFEDLKNNDYSIIYWENELGALRDVCSNIVLDINKDWDLNDPASYKRAQDISDAITLGQFNDAIVLWNDWSILNCLGIIWAVTEEIVYPITASTTPGKILFPQVNIPPAPIAQISLPFDDDDELTPVTGFKPTLLGATCRGACKQYNSYADADMDDGTYVCFQCKIFNHIFGTTK